MHVDVSDGSPSFVVVKVIGELQFFRKRIISAKLFGYVGISRLVFEYIYVFSTYLFSY